MVSVNCKSQKKEPHKILQTSIIIAATWLTINKIYSSYEMDCTNYKTLNTTENQNLDEIQWHV
jgi:hypothetical protein